MYKLFAGVVLLLVAGMPAQAQMRTCNPQDGAVWLSNQDTLDKLAKELGHFNNGVERARKHLDLRVDLQVVVVDCPYWGHDVVTRSLIRMQPPMYGTYVSRSYLQYTSANELERQGVVETCLVHLYGMWLHGTDDRQTRSMRAKRCMAEVVGDQDLLRWLARIVPPTPKGSSAGQVVDGATKWMQVPLNIKP